MIQHVWSVLCSQSIIDIETNNISLIGVLDQIAISRPTQAAGEAGLLPITCEVVSVWSREQEGVACHGRVRLLLHLPTGREIAGSAHDIDLETADQCRTRSKINGLPIQESGRYHFYVQLLHETQDQWTTVADIPLRIVMTSLGQDAV